MKRSVKAIGFSLLVALGVPAGTHAASENDWKAPVERRLKTTYKETSKALDGVRILHPGSVLAIQVDGIAGCPAGELLAINKVYANTIKQARSCSTAHAFKPGEKVYLDRIDVAEDGIRFYITSYDTFDVNAGETTKTTRYSGQLHFMYGSERLTAENFPKIKEFIDAYVKLEAGTSPAAPAAEPSPTPP